jgi:arginine N-succinyltransferase
MEDTTTNQLIGTSCIFSKTGGYQPLYAYKIETEKAYSEILEMETMVHSLHLIKEHNGPTEIGSLFLQPDYRGKGCGKLLSMSRFLYMAAHPKRFASETIAEMRGFQDAHGISPFWEAIGAHFFKIDFPRADSLSMVDKKFIEELMPKYPIYLELLPHDALESIGQVHEQTRPALSMLETQGFRRNNLIDIFDGGPMITCKTKEIAAIANSSTASWQLNEDADSDIQSGEQAILARVTRPYIAIQTRILSPNIEEGIDQIVLLSEQSARDLQLSPEDKLVVLPLRQ